MKLNIVVTNHGKSTKNLKSIIKNVNSLKDNYGNLLDCYFISSSQTEYQSKLISNCKSFDKIFFVDKTFAKFEKLKFWFDNVSPSKDDYLFIFDADDFIISSFLSIALITLYNKSPDILINSVFKVDPYRWEDQIKLLNWKGVSCNTIYKIKILTHYFEDNQYREILSEDNLRHIYALLDSNKILYIKSPFYIGFRWWESKQISNSSIANTNNQYNDSINVILAMDSLFQKMKFNKKYFKAFSCKTVDKSKKQREYFWEELLVKIDVIFRESILEVYKNDLCIDSHIRNVNNELTNPFLKKYFKKNLSKYKMWANNIIEDYKPNIINSSLFFGNIGKYKFKFNVEKMEFSNE